MKLDRVEAVLEIKAVSSDSGLIEGYGSVFNVVDDGMDIVAPGAFSASIDDMKAADRGLPMLWQHDPGDPIGVWTEASEDARGLKLVGSIMRDTTRGRDALAFIKGGAVRGLSIGFATRDADMDRVSGVRTIRKADLWEVSVVTFPMNRAARIDAVKFCDAVAEMTPREIERALRDAGLPVRDAKAAVSRLMDLGAERDAARLASAAVREAALRRLIDIVKS